MGAVSETSTWVWIAAHSNGLRHGSGSGHRDLTLDLLTSPPGGVNGTRAELSVCPSLTDKTGDPVVTEVGSELAVGEGISQITKSMLVTRPEL